MGHYVSRNSPGTPLFVIRGSEGVWWGGAGWDFFVTVFIILYSNFAVFYSISRPRGVFSRSPNDPKAIPTWSPNYPKTIPKQSNKYFKIIPKRSQHDPNMSPNVYRRQPTPQPHSRPGAHIHPSGGGRRSPRAARCCGAPERERGVFGFLQHFLTPQENAWECFFWVGRRNGSPKSTQL